MNRNRLLAIGVIVLALVVLIGMVYFFFLAPTPIQRPVDQVQQPSTQATSTPQLPTTQTPPVRRLPRIQAQPTSEDDLKRLAGQFVERYGTYSNQSAFANIQDLKVFMTASMQQWAESFIQDQLGKQTDNSIYYGLTTKSVVVDTQGFDPVAGTGRFVIQTQRQESIGTNVNSRSFQQSASVEFIKEGGVWKVNRVEWEK